MATAIKKCTITNERYYIEVISYSWRNQTAYVQLNNGTYIADSIKIVDGKAFWADPLGCPCRSELISEYKTQNFFDYIKDIVQDTLKWIEYWDDVDEFEKLTLEPDVYD